jgi:GH15 family glucan-1,4-alpha-glucosidase
VARYEGDEFFRTGEDAPANPWFITTFWKAQYEIARAGSRQELERVKDVFWWAVDHATESNMLSEQVRSDTGEQVSASPLAWSHAEYVSLVIAYARRYQELG